MKHIYSYIIILLFLLPLALQGQDFSHLPKRQSDDWQTIILDGGVVRFGEDEEYFVKINEIFNSLVMKDYVNGYSVGPRTTFGKVLDDYSRIEIDEAVRWSFSRKTLMAKGAVRYVFAPQYFGFFEVFGGRYTNDFDRYPVMDESLRSLAGVFGWKHYLLYDQTTVGTRLYGAVSKDLQVTGLVAWEKREALECLYFETNNILRLDAQLDWMPGRKILVMNDLDAIAHSDRPIFSLRATSGWNGGLNFLSLETSVVGAKKLLGAKEKFSYMLSAGFFPIKKEVMLMDAHHFNASEFAFQRNVGFSHFSLLDNYELSTAKSWGEAHAEWTDGTFYVQAHVAETPDFPLHSEIGGGYCLENIWRFGATVGFDDMKFDGVAFNICLNI